MGGVSWFIEFYNLPEHICVRRRKIKNETAHSTPHPHRFTPPLALEPLLYPPPGLQESARIETSPLARSARSPGGVSVVRVLRAVLRRRSAAPVSPRGAGVDVHARVRGRPMRQAACIFGVYFCAVDFLDFSYSVLNS